MNKGLFLDRDGVINIDHGYVGSVDRFEFQEGIFALARVASGLGYRIIVVTNQAGIARGYYDEAAFLELSAWMRDRFAEAGAALTDVSHCPFHRDGARADYARDSFWRKPNPGMILEAARRHALDLPRSIMVGDQPTDMEAAFRAGVGWRFHLNPTGGTSGNGMVVESLDAVTRSLPQLALAKNLKAP